MRFRRGGVGHKSTCKATYQFLSDCHILNLSHLTREGDDGEDAEEESESDGQTGAENEGEGEGEGEDEDEER